MRKVALILIVLLVLAPYARAGSLPLAADIDANEPFERFQSYKMDDATGEWSAHGLISQQMLCTVEQGDADGHMDGGVCVLYPGVRGNRDLSLMEPVLYVCLLKSSPIQAGALSIATGGVRYDFVGQAEQTAIGKRKCEKFTLPLNEDGLALLNSFAREGADVRVYGETKIFRTTIAQSPQYKNSKLRVEAMSVQSARDFLSLWPVNYALWDLNAAYWGKDRPQMAVVALEGDGYPQELPALDPATQCLDTQKGSQVRAYQQMLKDKAFFTAKPASNYGKSTRAATQQAQKYYGLLPTGMADRTLIERLGGAAQSAAASVPSAPSVRLTQDMQQAAFATAYILEGQLSLRLDRAWAAHSLSPSQSSQTLDRIWPADRSNALYIADGEIVNLSDRTLQLAIFIQGALLVDGIRYPCTIQCERDEGRSLGSTLLPMGKSRLVILCEMPRGIDLSSCALHLAIEGAAQKLVLQFA